MLTRVFLGFFYSFLLLRSFKTDMVAAAIISQYALVFIKNFICSSEVLRVCQATKSSHLLT